ncbi:hypothetical protein JAAARDRAFT_35143 [Jaapia argillacea MUCL 33604]|uniref:HAD-like protein n=1 Tax=Jaapia argillacea MUCL 33604 TaxID=933084 RepID=A0A067PUC1_9AGAM|nr:hypothetical protein JAAARDRAFT_35143 [Jaapia argillacea MUCL 33604]
MTRDMATTSGGPTPTRGKIEYVIFDLDGLMIDSERIYTDVTNQILAEYGKEMTWDIKAGLMGKPEKDAAMHLLSFFPDIPLSLHTYLTTRDKIQNELWPTVQPLPGIPRLISHLHANSIPFAIATGTRRSNFALKTSHLEKEIFWMFGERVICGDDDMLIKEGGGRVRGKPHPDIFLVAARDLLDRKVGRGEVAEGSVGDEEKTERAKGLVFEDAIPGVQAGKAAGMHVVWVPDSGLLNVEYSDSLHPPDQTLKSVEQFVPEEWGLPPYPPSS